MKKEKLDIDKILESLDRLAKSQEKTDKQIDKLMLSQEETDREIRMSQKKTDDQLDKLRLSQEETDRQFRMSQKEMDDKLDKLRLSQEETDREIKEMVAQMKQTDKKLKEVSRQLGDIGLIQGDFAEEMFFSSLLKKPVLGDIEFDTVEANVGGKSNDFEFDIVMQNGTGIGLIEVKYKARPKDVEKITQERVQNFRKIFPQYKDKKLYFGIATTISGPGLVAKAKKCGIFLLGQQGNHIELMNKEVRPF